MSRVQLTRGIARFQVSEREADAQKKLKLLEAASADLDEALQREPANANLYQGRAEVRSKFAIASTNSKDPAYMVRALELHKGAIEDYGRAIDLRARGQKQPEDVLAYDRRGWDLLLIMESPKLALPDFKEVLERDPKHADAYAGRGLCRVQLGDLSNGVKDAEQALELSAKSKESRFVMYNSARIYAQAFGRLDEVAKPDPATVERKKTFRDKAVALLEQTVKQGQAAQQSAFWLATVRTDAAFKPLRGDSRFKQMDADYGR